MKNLIFTLSFSVITTLACVARDVREIQFRTLCPVQVAGLTKVTAKDGGEASGPDEIVLYKDLSPVVKGAFRGDEAVFHGDIPGPDGKTTRGIVGKAALGKSPRQIFLFLPGAGGEGDLPYQVRAYDDGPEVFPAGMVMGINMGTVPIRFNLPEEDPIPVSPGEFIRFPQSKKLDEYKIYPVSIQFQEQDGKWVTLQSANWKADAKRREIVVVTEDAKTKARQVQMFGDFPEADVPSTGKKKKR